MSRPRIPPDDPLTAEIVRLYERGMSARAIAAVCHFNKEAVRKRLRSAGVKMRNRGRYPRENTTRKE